MRDIYPSTVAEVLDPPVRFKPETVEAVRRFKRSKPWRGTEDERKAIFNRLHAELCLVYSKRTHLAFGVLDGGCSGESHYRPSTDTITLCCRMSVVTYLHEFAHALGRDERGACRWSLNLFRQVFPRSFARAAQVGHTLRTRSGSLENDRPDLAD